MTDRLLDPLLRELGQRLKTVRLARGLVQADLAAEVGVSRAAISQWESGEVEATLTKLARAAHRLQVNLNWLVSGQALDGDHSGAPGVIAEMKGPIGAGQSRLKAVEQDWWRIPPDVLHGLRCEPASSRVFQVRSSTMAPTINRGAHVLVDFAQVTPHDGEVYVIDHKNALSLKRIHVVGSKTVELSGDAEPARRTKATLSRLRITGRVVAQLVSPL